MKETLKLIGCAILMLAIVAYAIWMICLDIAVKSHILHMK